MREIGGDGGSIWVPEPTQRAVQTHRGVVLGIGPPATTKSGAEVAHGFAVGDVVQFHFEASEDGSTREWPEDGKPAVWIRQYSVDAVIEP